jgi:hypothetical protein
MQKQDNIEHMYSDKNYFHTSPKPKLYTVKLAYKAVASDKHNKAKHNHNQVNNEKYLLAL